MIEVGRHKNLPKEIRFCPFCPDKMETEAHFLFECLPYNLIREKMLLTTNILIPNFNYYHIEYKMQHLLSEMDSSVVNFIAHASQLREFLTNKHKMVG